MRLRNAFQAIRYRISFRFRLVIALLFLAFFSTMIMACFCIYALHQNAIHQAEDYYGHMAEQVSDSLTAQAEQLVSSLSNIANNKAILNAFQNTTITPYQRYSNYKDIIDPVIASLIVNNRTIKNLTFYTSNPLLVQRGTTTMPITAIEDKKWFSELYDGRVLWHSEENGVTFGAAIPLPSLYNKDVYTVIDLQVDTNLFFDQFLSIPQPVILYVLDGDGQMMYTKNDTESVSEILAHANERHLLIDKTPYCAFVSCVATVGWKVILAVPENEYLPDVQRVLITVMPIVTLCIVLSILLSHVLANSLSGRIVNLSQQIESVSKGNMDSSVETPYRDEIGTLTRQFNQMVKTLRSNIENLKAAERKEIEAESAALRAQINPHFLYNALSVISWNAIEQGAPDVAQSISALSKFFRTVLNRGESECTLQEEIDNVDSYLSIQQEMHAGGFEFHFSIPEDLLDSVIPSFILQPIAENAVLHGVDRENAVPGMILISARRDGEALLLNVANSGEAFRKEELEAILSTKRRGYGLRNVQERVIRLCGEGYGLSLLTPDKPFTTCVQLKIKALMHQSQM